TIDLDCLTSRFRPSVGEDFEDLRTVAEGVGRNGQPATGEIRGDIDRPAYKSWRSGALNLRGTDGRGSGALLAKFDLVALFEIWADKKCCRGTREWSLRR